MAATMNTAYWRSFKVKRLSARKKQQKAVEVALSDIEIYYKILFKFDIDHSKLKESTKREMDFDKNQPTFFKCAAFNSS